MRRLGYEFYIADRKTDQAGKPEWRSITISRDNWGEVSGKLFGSAPQWSRVWRGEVWE